MPSVRFLPAALDDLDEIRAWVEADNPAAADALVDRLVDSVVILSDYPEAGGRRSQLGRGVRRIVCAPYSIFYRIDDAEVSIIRVLHGARRITRSMLRDS